MSMMRGFFFLTVLAVFPSCVVEQYFPEPVGAAVGRLTIRNMSYLVSLASGDDECGFASPAVTDAVTIDGAIGGPGTMTWVVNDCKMRFSSSELIKENCIGEKTFATGEVVFSAVRVVEGIITGDDETPIIPTHPDAAQLEISATFADFVIESSEADTALTLKNAEISFGAQIHLAAAQSNGLCSVPTSNLTFSDVKYEAGGLVEVKNGDQVFEVPVEGSLFDAQLGDYGEYENYLNGSIDIWETTVPVPELSEGPVLDPEYDADVFLAGFICTEDLKQPVSFVCKNIEPAIANGIAQLGIRDFAMAAVMVEDDVTCGFSSPQVLDNVVVSGPIGQSGGTATYTIQNPCRLDFEVPTVASEDCMGVTTSVVGSVIVTGTKTLRGIVTGDPSQPIVPQSRDPATIQLEIIPTDFEATKSTSTQSVLMKNGVLRGTFTPRTGLDTETGACSIVTPVTTFESIEMLDADVVLNNGGIHFAKHISTSRVNAQNGEKGPRLNDLTGTIEMDGVEYSVPQPGEEAILDPDYDEEEFLQAYACTPNLVVVESDGECDFSNTLSEGVARLVIQSVGTIASMINSDTSCGFGDLFEEISPSEVIGDSGDLGSMTWEVFDCTLGSDEEVVFAEDCIGGTTYQQGTANIDATRKVIGLREKQFFVVDSIQPLHPQSVDMILENVVLNEFVSFSVAAGDEFPAGTLTIHYGVLDAQVSPLLGEMQSDLGRFMVPTPVAEINEVVLRDATATLWSDGKSFDVDIEETRLFAVNGTISGVSNLLQGYIYINGQRKELELLPLNPEFSQAGFDASYACTEDLVEVLDVR